MSITDELRNEAVGIGEYVYTSEQSTRLLRIADRIDKANKNEIANIRDDALYNIKEKEMLEHGWVRLPVDMDDKPICVGDIVAYEDNTKPIEVVALVPPVVVITKEGPRYADTCRHYRPPTVEGVLQELVIDWDHASDDEDKIYILKKYAKKLQLKKDSV